MSRLLSGVSGVGIGACSLDRFVPVLEYGEPLPAPYGDLTFNAGEKRDLTPEDDALLHFARTDAAVVKEVGGNMPDALAGLVCRAGLSDVKVAMPLGVRDEASIAATTRLSVLGIADTARRSESYLPSESIIIRKRKPDGSIDDRMVLGRPRDPLDTLLDEEYLGDLILDADLVVAASIKDMLVNRLVSRLAKEKFTAWNFGSSELREYPEELCEMLMRNPAHVLSLNVEEAMQLVRSKNDNPMGLMSALMKLSKAAVLTDGKHGMWLGRKLESPANTKAFEFYFQPPVPVDKYQVVDTLGAGDATNAAAIAGFKAGLSLPEVGELCAEAGADAVQHVGAHTYVFQPYDPHPLYLGKKSA